MKGIIFKILTISLFLLVGFSVFIGYQYIEYKKDLRKSKLIEQEMVKDKPVVKTKEQEIEEILKTLDPSKEEENIKIDRSPYTWTRTQFRIEYICAQI